MCRLILRPTAYTPQPRFDPLLPLYYEDMDLCMRISELGNPILWLPSIRIVHNRGEGSQTIPARRARLSTCSYVRFLKRYRNGLVLFLRTLRLLGRAFLCFPITPIKSLAVFQGFYDALQGE